MPTFDTLLKPDFTKIKNGVDNSTKEIATRFDFKGTGAKVELKEKEKEIHSTGDSEFQLERIEAVLSGKLTKQDVVISFLDKQEKIEKLGGDKVRQVYKIKDGIEAPMAKKIVAAVKDSKLKVQASIQGDTVRITGKNRDDLQQAIAMLKEMSDVPLSFDNFRDGLIAMRRALALLIASLLAAAAAMAQPGDGAPAVSFNGSLGSKAALLMINGEMRTVPVGQRVNGVLLISMEDGRVVVESGGRRQTLVMGSTPVSVGSNAAGGGRKIVLSAGPGGHFIADGSINGKHTQFLVDTGATAIALSRGMARRMGLSLREGRQFMTQTANGLVPVSHVILDSVRIGDVEVRGVDAVIVPADMSHVLLGNSFLSRFQMQQENDILTLVQRF